jgi:YVTN family beta-propeller protein
MSNDFYVRRHNSPFKGPLPFTKDDKEWFFGRDDEIDEILSLVLGHKLVLIYGRSGAGKTSLLNAKIILELKKEGFHVLAIARVGAILPEKSLFASNPYIFNALHDLIAGTFLQFDISLDLTKITLTGILKRLNKTEKKENGEKNQKKGIVIIFDQLEELFTNIYSENWRRQHQDFFKQIADALDLDDFILRVVLIIREDYLDYLLPFARKLPENFRPRFRLERLSIDQAKEAIEEPLKKAKVEFREIPKIDQRIDNLLKERVKTSNGQSISMIEKIVNNLSIIRVVLPNEEPKDVIGDLVEPIHLQVVCEKLWSNIKSAQGSRITQEALENLGNVDKSLEELYVKSIRDVIKNSDSESKEKEHERHIKGFKAIIKGAYHLKSYIKNSRISEDRIRKWFDEKLITEVDTRDSVYKGLKSTEGMPNNIVETLEEKYLIRSERLPSGTFYKLTHDRLIKPIRKSNQERRLILAHKKSRNLGLISIAAFIIGIILVATTFVIIPMFQNEPCEKRSDIKLLEGTEVYPDDMSVNENTNMIYVIIHPSSQNDPSIKVIDCTKYDRFEENITEKGASKLAIDPKTNMIYVANTGSNTVSVIQDDASNDFLVFLKRLLPIYKTNLHNVKSIPVGIQPNAIAIDRATNKIYVANTNSNSVSVIDGDSSNPNVVKSIPVGIQPNAIAINPTTNKIYVANTGSNTVSVIDGKMDYAIIKNITVGKAPFAISIDEKTKKVYVANRDSNTLSLIDGYSKTNNVLYTIPVGKAPIDIAIDDIATYNNPKNDKSYIYVANADSETVSMIDGKTNNVIRSIPLEFIPRSIAVDRQSDMLYINSLDLTAGGILEVRDNSVPEHPKYVQVGNDPQHLAINPTTNKIYVANTGSDSVSVIDGKTKNVTNVIEVKGKQPSGIAINPTTNKIYVANTGSDSVSVIKDDSGNLDNITNLKVGKKPNAIAINPTTNKIYVANTGSDSVSVIKDDSGNIAIRNVLVGKNLSNLAVNPTTNKIYVANTNSNSVSVVDGNTDSIMKSVRLPFDIDQSTTMAVDPKANIIYVIGSAQNQFSNIDGITDNIIHSKNQQLNITNSLKGGPMVLAFNPNNDQIYAANEYFDTVSFINKSQFPYTNVESKVRGSPSDIAFDVTNNLLYVVNKDYNTIAIIQPTIHGNK